MRTSDKVAKTAEKWRSISSGETEQLERMQDEWLKLYQEDNSLDMSKRWSFDKVAADPGPFLEEIKKLRVIPTHRYVINYMMMKMELLIGDLNLKAFIKFIEEGEFPNYSEVIPEEKLDALLFREQGHDLKAFGKEEFTTIWKTLLNRLSGVFNENGYEKEIDWNTFFCELLDKLDYGKLKFMALGMHMSVTDFEIFLCKILKRANINFYHHDELLVYLTLRYGDEYGNGRYFEVYERLEQLYPAVTKEALSLLLETTPMDDDNWTLGIRSDLEDVIGEVGRELFEGKNEKSEKLFHWIACQNHYLESRGFSRTAVKEFYALWGELKDKLDAEGEITKMIEEDKWSGERQEGEQVVKRMSLRYHPEKRIVIPAGTVFECQTVRASETGGTKAEFRTEKEEVLMPVKEETAEVKVKALLSGVEFQKIVKERQPKLLHKLPQFVSNELLEREHVKIEVLEPELKPHISGVRVMNKVRFADTAGKSNEGTFEVHCNVGTFIPEGTHFKFCLEGRDFVYESIEAGNTCTIEIPVLPLNRWVIPEETPLAAGENQNVIQALTCPGFSYYAGGQVEVTSETPVALKKGTRFLLEEDGVSAVFETDKVYKIIRNREGKCSRFLKVKAVGKTKLKRGACAEKHTALVPRMEQSGLVGVISAEVGKSERLRLFQENKKPGFIEVTCKKACCIPEGTVFQYKHEGKEYACGSMEDIILTPYVETEIDVKWANVQPFRRTAEEKDREYIPSNTIFTTDIKGILHAYMEKRVVLNNQVEKERGDKSYQSSVSAMLRYLYPTASGKAENLSEYEGFPEYGEDFFLNTKLFKDTRITRSVFTVMPDDEERVRNLVLTLKFLIFVWNEDIYGDSANMLIADFETEADDEMTACGFYTYYRRGYPYDAFLALLLNCDEPCALFQAIWSGKLTVKKSQKYVNENKQ